MKKTRIFLLGIMAALLTGCGRLADADSNTIEIDKGGSISEVSVEKFEKGQLSENELETFVKQSIADYNAKAGKDTIELDKFKVKENTARVQMSYKSWRDYQKFHQVPVYVGNVPSALIAGHTFDGSFLDAKGAAVPAGKIAGLDKKYRVAAVSEAVTVIVPGEIRYVSENVKILDEDMAVIENANSENPDMAALENPAYIIYK